MKVFTLHSCFSVLCSQFFGSSSLNFSFSLVCVVAWWFKKHPTKAVNARHLPLVCGLRSSEESTRTDRTGIWYKLRTKQRNRQLTHPKSPLDFFWINLSQHPRHGLGGSFLGSLSSSTVEYFSTLCKRKAEPAARCRRCAAVHRHPPPQPLRYVSTQRQSPRRAALSQPQSCPPCCYAGLLSSAPAF